MLKNLNNLEARSSNIALLSDSSVTHNQRDLTLRLRRLTSMKSKLMVEALRIRSSLDIPSLRRKSQLTKSLRTSRPLMSSEPLRVRDSVVSLKDSELKSYQERLIEVLEKLVVLDHGIHLESNGLLLELVNLGTIIELTRIRRSIELERALMHPMLLLNMILLRNRLPQWEDSSDMERSRMTSSYSRDVV